MLPLEWRVGDYTFRVVEKFPQAEYLPLVKENLGEPWNWEELLSAEDLAKHEALSAARPKAYPLRLGVWREAEFVACTFGRHTEESTFSMSLSIVSAKHRRQGIYSEMLRYVIAFTKQAGFQRIISRHRATNNAVIIPKLKAGFQITGLELDIRMGTLVSLNYFHEAAVRKELDRRAGI
ncbi:MAG: hypothetical protein EOP11_11480 [Proteobacteria bacterium]|nr:MAG: hypothetical protein EOP11_11480 [Pseudomonadota bacterium]